jgi:hypothetical protein
MKTKLLAAIGILLTTVTLGFASTEKALDRPPGIAADQWFPISDHLGLVIPYYQPGLDPLIDGKVFPPPMDAILPKAHVPQTTRPQNPGDAMPSASAVPALTGYLMIKQGGHWTRLSVVSPPTLPPGTQEAFP